ncbi:MAG TPA: hypothetical protein VKX16_08295 [Chloroflexota bacterium]|nr:hypothetical protein [Chloroflexota bacterium]
MRALTCRIWLVGTTALLAALLPAATARAVNSVTPICNGQQCASGWYTSPVFVSWAWTGGTATNGCASQYYAADTVQTLTCSVQFPNELVTVQYILDLEISSPTIAAVPSRAPDFNGWYNRAVAVSFEGSSFSGIAFCTPPVTYAGPDAANTALSGSCTDNAGKTVGASIGIHYDATPPIVTGADPSRPPDFHGWYKHPITFQFTATDAVSGVASCSRVRYSGPDTARGAVIGTCRDQAGNVAILRVPIRYEARAPALIVTASAGDRSIALRWHTSAPLSSIVISRSPGLGGRARTSMHLAPSQTIFRDTRVQNGLGYRYAISARDQAGNRLTRTIEVTAGPHLLTPSRGAHLTAPPMLRWTAVRNASYYNVQLYRGSSKILSKWPTRASLRLSAHWSFAGRRFWLSPGPYRWYVWPGYGSKGLAHYGRAIGASSFIIDP